MALFLVCLLVVVSVELSTSHTIRDTNKLLKDKLADYNKNTRPTYNQSEPTVVSYNLELVYIQEFDEVQQKLSFIAVPTLFWVDEEMKWNPVDYGGMTSVVAPSGLFWIPNLLLANSADESKPIGDDWQKLRYWLDGSASYSPTSKYSSVCGADITYYPYDKHTCLLFISPQGYSESEVYLNVAKEKIGKNFYIENGGWDFVDSRMEVTHSEYYIELFVSITLQRKPRYVIVNIILPIIFLAYLSNVVFVIPADCGERISYSITVLLAIAVYLTIVGDNLPKTSFPMSYFSYYLMSMLVSSILISLATIFTLRIYHSDESELVTGIWAKLAACFKCRKRSSRKKYTHNTNADLNHEQQNGYGSQNNIHHVVISDMYYRNDHAPRLREPRQNGRHLDKPVVTSSNGEFDTDDSLSWKDVSVALDKIFFVIFFIILTVATIVYAVVIAREQSK